MHPHRHHAVSTASEVEIIPGSVQAMSLCLDDISKSATKDAKASRTEVQHQAWKTATGCCATFASCCRSQGSLESLIFDPGFDAPNGAGHLRRKSLGPYGIASFLFSNVAPRALMQARWCLPHHPRELRAFRARAADPCEFELRNSFEKHHQCLGGLSATSRIPGIHPIVPWVPEKETMSWPAALDALPITCELRSTVIESGWASCGRAPLFQRMQCCVVQRGVQGL